MYDFNKISPSTLVVGDFCMSEMSYGINYILKSPTNSGGFYKSNGANRQDLFLSLRCRRQLG
jgi:hypothetical protein